jgi:hypothetical protein
MVDVGRAHEGIGFVEERLQLCVVGLAEPPDGQCGRLRFENPAYV